MKSLIIGYGQIGKAVAEVISEVDEVTAYDGKYSNEPLILSNINIIHICFPCKEEKTFRDSVTYFTTKYRPQHVVIWATVPIGTTKKMHKVVHSPVEGRHPHLFTSIKSMTRWIGANDISEGEFFDSYFKKLYLKTRVVTDSNFTEALKLLSTTEYGVNIEFARYKKRVADELHMDYKLTKEWNQDYNKLYHNLGMDWAQKFILDAPIGPKGGHCVTPNALLLQEQFPDDLVKIVGELI